MIKKILIALGIIIVAAGIALGIFYFIKPVQLTPAAKNATSEKLVLDHSKDYGACTLLSVSSIKASLGTAAKDLQNPQNMGVTIDKYFGDGVQDIVSDSQTCIYAFVAGGTLDNSYNKVNSFSVGKTVFTNNDGPKALISQMKSSSTNVEISTLGDAAFYSADTTTQGPGATYSFNLQVFKDKTSTTYMIIQPAKTATFTAETAKTALLALAK